jgi:cell wall assembly regulator SMI1
VTDFLKRLEKWLAQHALSCYRSLLPGATPRELKAAAKALALQLPDALQDLYRWRNGQGPRSRPLFADAHARYTFLTLQQVQEAQANLNEILKELEDVGASGRDTWWHRAWVPFLDADGDHLCVDSLGTLGGGAGQVLSFFHDDSSRVIDHPSLRHWLETFVVSLEANLWQERQGTLELVNKEAFEQLARQRNPGYPVVVHSQL